MISQGVNHSLGSIRIIISFYLYLWLHTCFQDPAGIFELIEVVGNGTYGQVYKVFIYPYYNVSKPHTIKIIIFVILANLTCFKKKKNYTNKHLNLSSD